MLELDKEFKYYYDNYNGKPFFLEKYFSPKNDKRRIAQEYEINTLYLNYYISNRISQKSRMTITEVKFSDMLFGWVNKNKLKLKTKDDFLNIARNIFLLSGIYVAYEILFPERILEYSNHINTELKKVETEIAERESAKKKYLNEFTPKEEKEKYLNDKKNFLYKLKQQNDFIVNNKGRSFYFYLTTIIKIKEIQEITNLPRTKILNLISDYFYLFKIVSNKINFPHALNQRLKDLDELKVFKFMGVINDLNNNYKEP